MSVMSQIVLNLPDLYETNEAARMIGIGYATHYRWIKAGKLIPVRIEGLKNGRTLIPKSEIVRLNKRKEQAAEA